MTDSVVDGPAAPASEILRWTARIILLIITAFWLWFCIVDGLYDAKEFGPMGFVMMLPAALIAVAALYVAWRWELAGGILLLVVTFLGAFALYENVRHGRFQQWQDFATGLSIFVLPFLVPAVLLLLKHRLDQQPRGNSGQPAH